jgi:hypothetical protein
MSKLTSNDFQSRANEYALRVYGVPYFLTQDDVIDAIHANETPEYTVERKASDMFLDRKKG